MKRHFEKIHKGKLKRKICEHRFALKKEMKRHIAIVHEEKKPQKGKPLN